MTGSFSAGVLSGREYREHIIVRKTACAQTWKGKKEQSKTKNPVTNKQRQENNDSLGGRSGHAKLAWSYEKLKTSFILPLDIENPEEAY